MTFPHRLQNGFTIIELMITVAIISVLTMFALPAYNDYLARAQAVEAADLLAGLKTPVAEFYGLIGSCPNSNSPNGDLGNPVVRGIYVQNISLNPTVTTGCSYDALFKSNSVNSKLKNKIVNMLFQTASKQFIYDCSAIPADIRPYICH